MNVQGTYVRYYNHPLFIKATSSASDSDQQSILAQIQAFNTYSTDETLTGKTWIDGKPIYRKCFVGSFSAGAILVQNVDSLVGCGGNFMDSGYMTAFPLTQSGNTYTVRKNTTTNNLFLGTDGTRDYNIWVEYTKTTD